MANTIINANGTLIVKGNAIIESTGYLRVPIGDTISPGSAGEIRFNQTSGTFEGHTGNDWGSLGAGSGSGYTGSVGATGFTGSLGVTGFTGSIGSTGYTGSQGPIGYTGSKDSSVHAIIIACSDETTALSAEANVVTFRMPVNFTITGVRASLTTAQTSGNIFTVDVNNNGSSILSTKITIDNNEKTSTTAATAPVVSSSSVSLDDELTVDIDQIGNGTATGLKVTILGNPV
jgi:hypothetical protein